MNKFSWIEKQKMKRKAEDGEDQMGFNQNLSSFFKMHKLLLSSDQIQQNYTEKTT